ncbi:hypothetical protein PRIPAC_87063 [Pristionchus pacificus]|uniref:Uncharacterized protein n=1 Tax=Pristionchus pacificus TaxID=54126 RepID=A0A2A6CIH1_PRIPA|nr:hypothetical protein PRIPAC_87063 [Pristionchus pacificus]|eukprot:PDM78002.1 hypothetical protein PRIPAC_35191 [Pristionchus pacificus]
MVGYTNEEAAKILEPFIIEYGRLYGEGDSISLSNLYSPNAVLIEKDKQGVYGRSEIEKFVRPFMGDVKVCDFTQIFRKEGEKWLIIHDEFRHDA